MRVFILGTGRCGTLTFVRACAHLGNFSAGHETRSKLIGDARFDYPDQHIEADNRLSWFLGDLAARFPDAAYVHLRRHRDEVIASFLERWDSTWRGSIIRAFAHAIVMHPDDWSEEERREVCGAYVDTVTRNIDHFLTGRRSMTMWLHEAHDAFPSFLEWIAAEGDRAAALGEWQTRHNATQRRV